ncbi:MAG: DUF1549 domain-containing protein [Planctomycetes bacterium]|nr:DUF1549 domain-containing protein [Planctomycetota bacterium]
MMRNLTALVVLVAASSSAAAQPELKLLPADRAIEQAIDHYVDATLKENKIAAAPAADDAAFLRRATLDLNGRVPTLGELQEYLAGNAPDKKAKLVDRLMASGAYARHNAQSFYAFMQYADGRPRKGDRGNPLYDYLLTSFSENRAWDRIFKEMMLPDEKDPKMQGANDFLKSRVKDLNKLTIEASSTFFGVNVSCAQCHDHPHVHQWTQDQFYGMKSFFARTVDSGGFLGERDFGVVKYIPNKGTEKVSPVLFLSGRKIDAPGMKEPNGEEKRKEQLRLDVGKKAKTPPAPPAFSLRAKLVETALAPDQRGFFARNIANRLVHRFLGRGLVMPLDQVHSENPPSHPELLEWLARDTAEHGYDLRRLTRGIVLSNAYARSSRWEGEKFPEERFFAVAMVRPLAPMQMAASLKIATADPLSFPADRKKLEERLEAIEKSGAGLANLFAQPTDSFQIGVAEAMLFANNEALQRSLLEGAGTLTERMKQEPDMTKRAELAIRTVLNRSGRTDEVQSLVTYMQRRQDRPDAANQQVIWALLTSAEFRFNH